MFSPKEKRKEIFKDPLALLPKKDKIVTGRSQENDVYQRLQEYLKDHDAKLYHFSSFKGKNFLGEHADGSKEIYHLEGTTIGVIPYKTRNEEKPRIIVTVSGDEEIKKEIKDLFDQ